MEAPGRQLQIRLPILDRLAAAADRAPIDAEERLRLHHYSVFMTLGVPAMLVFGAINLVRGSHLIGVLIVVSAVGLVGGWYVMMRWGRGRIVYRANFLFYALISTYGTDFGGPGGSYCLWSYFYPLIAFFLFGLGEGLVWSAVMLTGVVGAMVLRGGYPYEPGFVLRFAVSYSMVVAVTFGYEHLRAAYRRLGEREQEALEREVGERRQAEAEKEQLIGELRSALDEVKTLQGLIPICAGCHQIRDDEGFWRQLETYFEERSDARFSHGLCPACARRLYPDYVDEAPTGDAADRPRPEGP